MDNKKVRTDGIITWCPGCFNFQILAGMQQFLEEEIKKGKKKEDFAIVVGIGCHAKIFDYHAYFNTRVFNFGILQDWRNVSSKLSFACNFGMADVVSDRSASFADFTNLGHIITG